MFRSKLFFHPHFLFDADTGNGGGSGDNTSTGEGDAGEGNTSQGGQAGQGQTQTTGGGQQSGSTGGSQQTATFTQADLDRIAGNTRKEAMAKFAKDHGFESVEALKAAVKAQKEAEDKAKSDLQKAQEAAQAEKTAREAAESELRRLRIETAILEKATALNFANPRDAMALLDMSKVEIDEAGKVVGYEKALDDLAKSNRLPLKNQQQGAGIGNQTRTRTTGGQTQNPASQQNNQGAAQRPIVRL